MLNQIINQSITQIKPVIIISVKGVRVVQICMITVLLVGKPKFDFH